MPAFAVILNGRNFLVELDGELRKHGFYTQCEVEARDEEEAELLAVSKIREQGSLRDLVRNRADDPPTVYADEISEIASVDSSRPIKGLAWYREDDAEVSG